MSTQTPIINKRVTYELRILFQFEPFIIRCKSHVKFSVFIMLNRIPRTVTKLFWKRQPLERCTEATLLLIFDLLINLTTSSLFIHIYARSYIVQNTEKASITMRI